MEEEKKCIESRAQEQIRKLQDEKKGQLARVEAQMTDIMGRLDPDNEADHQEFGRLESILETFASLFPKAFVKKYKLKFGDDSMYPLAFLCSFESKESLREQVFDLLPKAAGEALRWYCSYDCNFANPTMMKWLLTKKPDMASKSDDFGYLPLHDACANGKDLQVIKLLVEANPESVNTKINHGDVPIQLALRQSSLEVIQYLMERQDPKPTADSFLEDNGSHVRDLLHSENLDVVKYIFEMFPSLLTAKLPRHGSPLHYALQKYNLYNDKRERVALLLKLCGRAASMKNKYGEIPLQIALGHGDRLDDKTLVDLVCAYPDSMDATDETTGEPIVDFPTAKRISKFYVAQDGHLAISAADVEPPKKKARRKS